MGCIYSINRKEAMRKNKTVTSKSRKKYLPPAGDVIDDQTNSPDTCIPDFTDHQKELVVNSWSVIRTDIDKLGVQMFMKLFETHPDVQDVFMPFKGLSNEDLTHSKQLRSHAIRVLGIVDKCLDCIHDDKMVIKILQDLGSRHVMYTAKVDYIDLIGPQFIWAIQPAFGDQWTPELEGAWSDLFKLISYVMKNAMVF